MLASEFVNIDVGGANFKTMRTTLLHFPNTRLGKIFEQDYIEFPLVFDRNPKMFPYILDYYRIGKLHLPSNMCGALIKSEMEYWQIQREEVADCCLQIIIQYEDGEEKREKLRKNLDEIKLDYTDEECEKSKYKYAMRKLWLIFDHPQSSKLAYIYSIVFLLVTLLSVFLFCSSTHPLFRTSYLSFEQLRLLMNSTFLYADTDINNPKHVMHATTTFNKSLYITENVCLVFFTLDLIFHFVTCPIKLQFLRFPLNFLDAFLAVMMWTVLAFEFFEVFTINKTLLYVYFVFKCFSILRLFRLFRLLKQHEGLNILFMAIRSSKVELLLLMIVICIIAVCSANIIYYAEIDDPSTFSDVFSGIWWSIITITTVGYGDMYPKTLLGRIVGASCALLGILVIAMPIAMIAANFSGFYEENKIRETRKKEEKRRKTTTNSKERQILDNNILKRQTERKFFKSFDDMQGDLVTGKREIL